MTDPVSITVVLGLIANKIFDALLYAGSEKVVDEAWGKLKDNEANKAFKLALGTAIKQYAKTGMRSALTGPLLDENGLLTEDPIVEELVQILRFQREPNCELIGERWKAMIKNPPQERNFTVEAQVLINCLKDALQNSEVFTAVFELKSLSAINVNVSTSARALINIEAGLVGLRDMMNSQLGELIGVLARTNPDIQHHILDFTWRIRQKTEGFIGRHFIFEQIERFLRRNNRGYFLITGKPGIGKTALMASWIKENRCVHHFNIRSSGINRSALFLENICAQIIAAYELDYTFLPPEATRDSFFLIRLLHEVSDGLRLAKPIIIAVDAVDEVEDFGSANALYLPETLPRGVYVILTSRTDPGLTIDCEQQSFFIDQRSEDNKKDIRQFLEGWTEREGIQAYINAQKIDREIFLKSMTDKSEGNFMYLHYVLPEIEGGAYKDLELDKLPSGLESYYNDHWKRMRKQSDNAWLEYKLPILVALSIAPEPVSIERIADFSRVQDHNRIFSVLDEWQQFLDEQEVEYEGSLETRYQVYHESFREFIASQKEVNLTKAYRLIADKMREEIHGKSD